MKRYWMRSLAGQMVVLLLSALVLSHVVGFVVYRDERTQVLRDALKEEFLARTASVTRLLDAAPADLHGEILRAGTSGITRYWLGAAPVDAQTWQEHAASNLMRALPLRTDPDQQAPVVDENHLVSNPYLAGATLKPLTNVGWEELPAREWPLGREAKLLQLNDWNGFGLAVPLSNGVWLNAVYAKPVLLPGVTYRTFIALGIAAIALTFVAIVMARRIAHPLRQITEAAERIGVGEEVDPIRESGPDDLRTTAAAFNRMQTRLRRFIDDRTRMLAAVGHDLRTPITSMRLRAEFVPDADLRENLIASLDEMQTITEATLTFAREDATREETRTVDLSALLESLCNDLTDLGWDVTYKNGQKIPFRCRPQALRRAVRNLVENAVRYGQRARVILTRTRDTVEIVVEDDGEGIPEQEFERVFQPFVRLESSRNRQTGGVGLGLSIARSLVRSHGGDILLFNGSGLHAVVRLPQGAA